MALNVYNLTSADELDGLDWFNDLRDSAVSSGEMAEQVAAIVADVRRHGDDAVVKYMRQWTDPAFDASRIRVSSDEMSAALDGLDATLRAALEQSARQVREYQSHVKPSDPPKVTIDGAELGLRFTPIDRVGCAVPGGKAAYPSSVIMQVVPAQAAGVDPRKIAVVSPPPTRTGDDDGSAPSDINPLVLATCAMLGVERVYRIGGAQAMAALAFGTQTVEPVDLIVGPGNAYTQLAKQQLMGRVGIDGFYGPSEIVTVADESANARRVAADLIAQAEHDPGRCMLVAWSRDVIDAVNDALTNQLKDRSRVEAIEASLDKWSAAMLVPDEVVAADVANRLAAEHVNLAVADPDAWLGRLRHGGEVFLGDQTPVAAGDYFAGPSHCLPTGTTARFGSGISVYTFLKRTGTVCYRDGMSDATAASIARLAEAEGLDGHAASVRVRRDRSN